MKKVHLVLQREIVKQTKCCSVWSDWHIFSCDDCFSSIDDALARVNELRQIAESKNYDFVDYRAFTLFVH